jgi:diketogulonate reductase-like aldo/keto reductase
MSMDLRVFGPDGPRVAVVGQGTWHAEQSPREAVDALRHGLDLGMRHLDTAEMYGSGAAESIVGRAIEGRRDEVFLVSKVLPSNASRRATIAACERSLARLQTDRLDCYLLHWRGAYPLAETVAAFEELRSSGKIRAWGVSNFDVDDLEELASLAGAGLPACNQVLYHLEERAIEHTVLPWCQDRGVAIVAYTPFGQSPQAFDPQTRHGRVLKEIGASHGATARQVALAFLLRHAFVIPKAARRDHASENAGAAALRLTAADYARIDAAFPRGKPRALPMI